MRRQLAIVGLLAALALALAANLYAMTESKARTTAKEKFGPMVRLKKTMGVADKDWKVLQVYIPSPLCADKEVILGEGATWEAAFADFDKRHPKGVMTVSGQVNTAHIEVDSRIVTSMRLASDSNYDGAEVFRPITNQIDVWVHEFKQNIGALQPGIHAWCPVFFGSELPHSGKSEPAQLFRVVH